MNARLVLAPALAAVLAVGAVGAHAATPTLDGKKVKKLAATYTPAAQDNDATLATDLISIVDPRAPGATNPERTECAVGSRCGRITFKYLPAKGVRGGMMIQSVWSNPTTDIDLYLAEVAKDGSVSQIASCGGSGGTSEKIYVAPGELRPGRTYAVITDFFRVASDTVKTSVVFPGANTMKSTLPAGDGAVFNVNCTQ